MPTATCDTCQATVTYRGTRGGGLAGSRCDCGGTLRGTQAGRPTGKCASCGRRTNLRIDRPWARRPLWGRDTETPERLGPFPADTFCCRNCSGHILEDLERWLDYDLRDLIHDRAVAAGQQAPRHGDVAAAASRTPEREARVAQDQAAIEMLTHYIENPEAHADRITTLRAEVHRLIWHPRS